MLRFMEDISQYMTTEIPKEIKASELKRGMIIAGKGSIIKMHKTPDFVNVWFQGCYVSKQYQANQMVSVVENQ